MDASESLTPNRSFEDFLAGNPSAGGEAAAEPTAVVPPPLGAVDADPATNQVALNIRRELTHQLRSSDANVLDAAFRVRASGNMGDVTYHADVIVDAGEPDRDGKLAREPKVIFEVAATGSERAQFIESWSIHEKMPTVDVHALVDPQQMSVLVRRRTKNGWEEEALTDSGDQVFLPTIHCLLTLETIYEGAANSGDEERI